jgi:hypothetical protein
LGIGLLMQRIDALESNLEEKQSELKALMSGK